MRAALAAVLAFAICGLCDSAAFAQVGGHGIGSGRATANDVVTLSRDLAKVLNAERALAWERNPEASRSNVEAALSLDGQRQILGDEGDGSQGDLALSMRRWWIDHVLQPALDIAANPAASCGLATQMLRRILVLERQAQVLGLEEARFGDFGDGDSILGRAFLLLQRRCLAEAFDECMETGNGKALINFVGSFRSIEGDPLLVEQAVYLFRRCTVYSIVYHLELDGAVRDIRQSIVADGSFRLLFSSDEDGDATTRLPNGVWSGPLPQDMASPNVLLSALNCGAAAVSCDLDEAPFGGLVSGRVSMTRHTRPQTIRVVTETQLERSAGVGRVVIENDSCGAGSDGQPLVQPPEGCREGESVAIISFAPPDFITMARLRPGYGPLTRAGPGSDIYYLATASTGADPATMGAWTREGYPLLFTAAVDRTEVLPGTRGGTYHAHLRATFELRHRPDLYPPEEIQPANELPAERPEAPARIPLR